jgi:hypothetical protein
MGIRFGYRVSPNSTPPVGSAAGVAGGDAARGARRGGRRLHRLLRTRGRAGARMGVCLSCSRPGKRANTNPTRANCAGRAGAPSWWFACHVPPRLGASCPWQAETLCSHLMQAFEAGSRQLSQHRACGCVGAKSRLVQKLVNGPLRLRFAQALPEGGRLVACDRDADSLAIARRTWDAAGVGHKVRPAGSACLHSDAPGTAAHALSRVSGLGRVTAHSCVIDRLMYAYIVGTGLPHVTHTTCLCSMLPRGRSGWLRTGSSSL